MTAMAAAPGGVSSMATSRAMLDVMVRVRESDAVERQVGRNGVDQLPAFEQRRRVTAGRDDFGPVAQFRGVVLGKLFDQPADAVEHALLHGRCRGFAESFGRARELNLRELRRLLMQRLK